MPTATANQATETDLALPFAVLKTVALNQASETDLALPITPDISPLVLQASETDTVPGVLGVLKTKEFLQASETDSALAFTAVRGISIGTIAAPGIIGPYIAQGPLPPDVIDVMTIPSKSTVTGPVWIANDDSDPYVPVLSLQLLEAQGEVVVAGDPLATAFGVTWFDELNGPGFGSLQIPLSETAAVAELTPFRLVRCFVGGVMAFTWQIENQPKLLSINDDEEYGQIVEVRGRGWASTLDDAIVYPPIPIGETSSDLTASFLGSERVFSFASPDYPDVWGNPNLWPFVLHAGSALPSDELQPWRYERVETSEDVWENLPAPVGWPWSSSEAYVYALADPTVWKSHWIWPTTNVFEVGWAFFIGDFLYPDPARPLTITTTADNMFTMFMDGTPVLGETEDAHIWKGWKEVTPGVPPDHIVRVACVVENIPWSAGSNPGGWLLAMMYNDDAGTIEDIAMVTNGAWRAIYSPSVWPGWTAGQIMSKLIGEAITRNVSFADFTYDFSSSAGSDGLSWDVTIDGTTTSSIPIFSISLGSSYLQVLEKLHDDGWINWRMSAGGLILQMWSFDSPPLDSGAVFAAADNIMSLERESDQPYANSLLVSYDSGFVVVEDAAGIAARGRREDVLSSDAATLVEAQRMGGYELEKRAIDAEGGAIAMTIEPSDTVNQTDIPYIGFQVGEGVTIPSLAGGTALVRVMSITARQDDMGDLEFILELNKRWPVLERDTSKLLRSIGGKTQGSAGTRGVVT